MKFGKLQNNVDDFDDIPEDEYEVRAKLIERAQNNDRTEFKKISNYDEYRATKVYLYAVKHVAKDLRRSLRPIIANCVRALEVGQDDFETLLAYKLLKHCAEFYTEEARTVANMIADYENYLFSGNLIRTFILGIDRDEVEDLYGPTN